MPGMEKLGPKVLNLNSIDRKIINIIAKYEVITFSDLQSELKSVKENILLNHLERLLNCGILYEQKPQHYRLTPFQI